MELFPELVGRPLGDHGDLQRAARGLAARGITARGEREEGEGGGQSRSLIHDEGGKSRLNQPNRSGALATLAPHAHRRPSALLDL